MRRAMLVLGLAACGLLGASDDPAAAGRYFLGAWKCGTTTMTFGPLRAGGPWMRLAYGARPQGGIAIVGYAHGLDAWLFRDFHDDGAYADLASPGPSDGRWQWTGPYYPQEGGPPLSSRMTYTVVSPTHFTRSFEVLRERDFVPTGNDSCVKMTA